jgi:FMN-dependent NADH-azoreductase
MSHEKPLNILRITASARQTDSVTRRLADRLLAGWQRHHAPLRIVERDLALGLPLLDAEWIAASYRDADARSARQHELLALSERLIGELEQAEAIVLAVPLYNFSIPAVLKAWIDLVTRARRTFRYTEQGSQGLLADKPVFLLMASGGVEIGGAGDFASAYLRHVLAFIGLKDVRLLAADGLNRAGAQAEQAALARVDRWSLSAPLASVSQVA